MTIDQARVHHPPGAGRADPAAGAGTEGFEGDVASRTHLLRIRLAGTVGVVALVAAVALAVWPYQRGLVGYLDGDKEIVRTACGAPIVAAFSERTGNLLVDETTWANDPPCQRTAAFRLGLAGILGALGLLGMADAWRHRTDASQRVWAQRRSGRPLLPHGS
jgi:hypothetical protein